MKSSSVASPPTTEKGVKMSAKPPRTRSSAFTGRPSISFAIVRPQKNEGSRLPRKDIQSQNERQRGWST